MHQDQIVLQDEKQEQEYQANRYALRGIYYTIATAAVVWVLNTVGFFILDKTMMNILFVGLIFLLLIPTFATRCVDSRKVWLKYVYLLDICIVTAFCAACLTFHAVLLYVLPLLFAVQYRERKVLWITYVTDVILMGASTLAGFYYGLCDLNILFVSSAPRAMYVNELTGEFQNLVFNENPVYIILIFATIPRGIILFLFTRMLQHINERGRKEEARLAKLRWKSETDLVTNSYNKGKFEEMAAQYYPEVERIAVIFWDINYLKVVNDKHGHAAGDRVIRQVASYLYEKSDERRLVYRMGGDEFAMVIENPEESEPLLLTAEIERRIAADREKMKLPMDVSTGWSFGPGSEIQRVLREADSNMYEAKKQRHRQGIPYL